ncbi:MAG: hypothetical protein AAFU03_09765, partial [Bacteroidota bacterium]
MNTALVDQKTDQILACYADEMDWENSFGWTIKDKNTLSKYFKDWLFVKYPGSNSQYPDFQCRVELLREDLAWVEVMQGVYATDSDSIVRSFRQTHLVLQQDEKWLIKKTRMWAPNKSNNPPVDYITSDTYFGG